MLRCLALLLVFIVPAVAALQITIEDENFYPGQKSKSILITNPSESPIAVEARAVVRTHTIDGKESLDNHFSGLRVLPAQMVIGAGEEQVINLRLMQTVPSDVEQALRLIIETVPVTIPQPGQESNTKGGLELVYRIVRSLYLTPKSASSNVAVSDVSVDAGEMLITMKNNGNAHQIMYEFTLEIDNQYTFTATTQALKGGVNLLAGETREITLPKPNDWPAGKWTSVKVKSFK
jgi:P pilus assembly chaperone PapD